MAQDCSHHYPSVLAAGYGVSTPICNKFRVAFIDSFLIGCYPYPHLFRKAPPSGSHAICRQLVHISYVCTRAYLISLLRRETNRQAEIKELTSKGKIPFDLELDKDRKLLIKGRAHLMGSVSAVIHDILPAKTIIDNMLKEAVERLQATSRSVNIQARL
jgi:hypothetical protein